MNGLQPEIVNLNEVDESELIVHSESEDNPHYAYMLSRMKIPICPSVWLFVRFASDYDDCLDQVEKRWTKRGGDLRFV